MKHRGIKITEYVDRRSGAKKFKARFKINNVPYAPKKLSLESLKKEINRIFASADNGQDARIDVFQPVISDILYRHLETITDGKKYLFYKRVYQDFLSILPPIKFSELTQADFTAYAELRRKQINKRTGEPPKNATINKEFSAVNVALKNAPKYFRTLHEAKPVTADKLSNDYEPRTRTLQSNELTQILAELGKPKQKSEREYDYFYRVRLGHLIEFNILTGLRRKELALLEPKHFDEKQNALVNWKRPKTKSEVAFFPLRLRAAEILKERIKLGTPFLFSDNGKPVESHYRKLKNLCDSLNIEYGANIDGGFVLHDLRRNFGTEVVRHTDIETARELLGHADLTHTGIYLATDKKAMIRAVQKMDGFDVKSDLKRVIEDAKSNRISVDEAVEEILKITAKG